jgi:uncharacterized protein (DUF427 family)
MKRLRPLAGQDNHAGGGFTSEALSGRLRASHLKDLERASEVRAMDVMKVPGPDHPITLTGNPHRVRALHNGHVIADSADVLVLKEASYKPVAYFPRQDVQMAFLSRTGLDTYCPYKGHANYFTLMMDGVVAENAAWTYETPYPSMEAIAGRLAFYPNVVVIEEAAEARLGATVDEVVQHTDSGSGASQREHWPETVHDPVPPE